MGCGGGVLAHERGERLDRGARHRSRLPSTSFGVRTLKFAPSPTPHWTAAWDVSFMVMVP